MNFEWSEHMQETVIVCSLESVVSTATMRGSIRPALMSATPTESRITRLFSSRACAAASGGPPVPVPSAPNCAGSIGAAGAAGATGATAPGTAAGAAGAAAAASPDGAGADRRMPRASSSRSW